MPRIVVDRETCMQSGQCYQAFPHLVQPDEEDIPVPTAEEFPEDEREQLVALTKVCPTRALAIRD